MDSENAEMTKIIAFGKAEGQRKQCRVSEDLFSGSVDYYDSFLSGKLELFRFMVEDTKTFLTEEGIRAEEFEILKPYFQDFLKTEMDPDHPEEDVYVELAFQNVRPERILATCTFAVPDENGNISLTHALYQLLDYREGNRNWLVYNFPEKAWQEGGEDLFDLEGMLAEARERENRK